MRIRKEPLDWRCGPRVWSLGARPLVMGILNVTPDSFSDGGRYADEEAAVQHGFAMMGEGADIIDVGGESTRPGATPVDPADEARRVVPVIRRLARAGAAVSVDTRHASVAAAAVEAGACIVNDVSGAQEPAMVEVVKRTTAGVVVMHMPGNPQTMQSLTDYRDVVEEVARWLEQRVEALAKAGIRRECIAVDPGFGFGKNLEQNAALLARLDRIGRCGRPVVAGLSRKSWLGHVTGRPVNERVAASVAALCAAVLNGARIVRVHDVRESMDASRVLSAIAEGAA